MPNWSYTLDVSDVFHNEAMSFTEIRDAIVVRIETSSFWYLSELDGELFDLVFELKEARNVPDFDTAWEWFYDWADFNRVWVRTF